MGDCKTKINLPTIVGTQEKRSNLGVALLNDDFNYNSRRNNMDFCTYCVVVMVRILLIIAWIEDQSNKTKWK